MTPHNERLVRIATSAMVEEGDRWFIKTEDGQDHICRREDWEEDEESTVVMSVGKGDGDMHFWDVRFRAMAVAVLESAGITLD
jgi:hypothetical protein